jgi:S-adenosyl methyltransferase
MRTWPDRSAIARAVADPGRRPGRQHSVTSQDALAAGPRCDNRGPVAGPPSFDTSHAHPARVYDYLLGGTDNYPANRETAEIVYVDRDPAVAAHARALLTSTPDGATAYVDADARDTATILAAAMMVPLDLGQSVAVMLLLVLQYVPDFDGPRQVVSRLMEDLPSGSYLTVSGGCPGTSTAWP